jgi:hypothetical protein
VDAVDGLGGALMRAKYVNRAAAETRLTPGTVACVEQAEGIAEEHPETLLVEGLCVYVARYRRAHGRLADDGVLGAAWLKAWRGVRQLLNGDIGSFDGGTLDHALMSALRSAGFSESEV